MGASETVSKGALAGVVSGVCARLATSPLDVLKIRFQLQLEDIHHGNPQSRYHSITQAVRMIASEEGIRAFWKGHLSGQMLYAVYGGSQFMVYEASKHFFCEMRGLKTADVASGWNFLFGYVSGSSATVVAYPLDCLRTRLVGQGEPKVYRGITHASRSMFAEGGIRTFYKGLLPTLLQVGPVAAQQFGVYHTLKAALPPQHSQNPVARFLCGAAAGITSKVTMLPFDLVKKRLQVQGFEVARSKFGRVMKYTGMLNCLVTVVTHEGVFALYKGTTPTLLKATFTVATSFLVYDTVMDFLTRRAS